MMVVNNTEDRGVHGQQEDNVGNNHQLIDNKKPESMTLNYDGGGVSECNFEKGALYCNTHACATNKIVVTSKKWRWRPKKKDYGYVSVKTTKYVCSGKNKVRGDLKISTSRQFGPEDGVNSGRSNVERGLGLESESCE